MRSARLKAFIVKVRTSDSTSEIFYILARDIHQARLRAVDLSRLIALPDTVAA